MITGFDKETEPLSDVERQQARLVWYVMNAAFKRGESITNKQIRKVLETNHNTKVTDARIRKMINWMHIEGHIPDLIASNNGYAKAKSAQELKDYIESLRSRVVAINGRLSAAKRDLQTKIQKSQLSLYD